MKTYRLQWRVPFDGMPDFPALDFDDADSLRIRLADGNDINCTRNGGRWRLPSTLWRRIDNPDRGTETKCAVMDGDAVLGYIVILRNRRT